MQNAFMTGLLSLSELAHEVVAEICIAISALDFCCATSLLCSTGLASQQQLFRWLSALPT